MSTNRPVADAFRPLGHWPTVQAVYHARYAGSGTMVMAARVAGPLAPDRLRQALADLVARHSLLGATLVQGERELGWQEASPKQERDGTCRVLADPVGSWPEIADQETADPPAATGPLWRLTLAPAAVPGEQELILTTHHSLLDGRAGVQLLWDLLTAGTGEPGLVHRLARWPLPAPLESRLPAPPPGAPAGDRPASGAAPTWPLEGDVTTPRSCRLTEVPLAPGLVPALRLRARLAGATVQGALLAAVRRVAGLELGDAPPALSTAVDLRGEAVPRVDLAELGCFMTMVPTNHPLPVASSFWEEAGRCTRALGAQLQARRSRGWHPRRSPPALLDRLTAEKIAQAHGLGRFAEGPALSNLGVVSPPALPPGVRVKALRFTSAQTAGLYPLFLTFASLGAEASCCLSTTEPLLSRARAARLARDLSQELTEAARP